MALAPPTLAFAVLGQARASGRLSPERESRLLRHLIITWAVTSALETARATTRSDVGMFVGQPTIWTDARTTPAPTHRNLNGGPRSRTIDDARPSHRITVGGIVELTVDREPLDAGTYDVEWEVVGSGAARPRRHRISQLGTTTITGRDRVVSAMNRGTLIRATLDTSPLTVGSWRVCAPLDRGRARSRGRATPPTTRPSKGESGPDRRAAAAARRPATTSASR